MTHCEEWQQTESEDIDDLNAYIATLSDEERQELAIAEIALDIAILLHRARERRGLSQAAAAGRELTRTARGEAAFSAMLPRPAQKRTA